MTNVKKKLILITLLFGGVLFLSGCSGVDTTRSISGFIFEDLFVYPIAGLFWVVAKTIGFGHYGITIIISTLIVRSIAWPIYAKTNDLSLKMQLVQPLQAKIEKKYEGKEDQASKQRKQMETMQLYKKYGIGIGGCLAPILQFPIFIGVFRTISRMPATITNLDTGDLLTSGHWLRVFDNVDLFGINLLAGRAGDPIQNRGVIIFAALVGITQIISLIITQRRQKKMKESQQSDVPAYRRGQKEQTQKTTQNSMMIMMFVMTGMMVVFVLNSPAGLGLYWVVGNLFSTGQSSLTHLTSKKRLEKLKEKY